jgi:hypothetical protein
LGDGWSSVEISGWISGFFHDVLEPVIAHNREMPSFRIVHRHNSGECPAAYAAWKGFDGMLRGQRTTSSCRWGDHQIWWDLEAANEVEALRRLPRYVSDRAVAVRIGEVDIP